jgi:hypothetical protein
MSTGSKSQKLENFRAANCKAKSCLECETNRICMVYLFFSARDENNKADIEVVVELLEANGFHVTDAREERATRTETSPVIDDKGIVETGAILLRVIPSRASV